MAFPHEVLAAVFAHLSPCELASASRVCKSMLSPHTEWHSVAHDQSVWTCALCHRSRDAAPVDTSGFLDTGTSLRERFRLFLLVQCLWGRSDASDIDTRVDLLELFPRRQAYRPNGAREPVERIALEYVPHLRSPQHGILLASTSRHLCAIDARSGDTLWSSPPPFGELNNIACYHLERSGDWLVQDNAISDRVYIWKRAQIDEPDALRGAYRCVRVLDEPGRALCFHSPILARYVAL